MAGSWGWRRAVLACASIVFASQAFASTSDDIKALLEQGKAKEAYAEGKKYPDQLGDPSFDFYFGIAAIDSGHAGEGVLALERYLLNFPDNLSAQLQLARGYYVLGDNSHARAEFESIRKLNPPPDVVATIERFLDAIRLREARYSPSAGAFVEIGVGRDSNVNAGPASSEIFLPGFGLLPLNESSQKTADNFASVGAGGFVSYPVRPGVTLFANGQAERKYHESASTRDFELGNYNASAGVSIVRERNTFRLSASYGVLTVGSPTYRSATGASGEWQHQLDGSRSLGLGMHVARLSYNDANSPRDADFIGFSGFYRQQLQERWQPILMLGLNGGRQRTRTERPELVPRSYGASGTVTFTPAERWGVLLGYTYQYSDYQGPDFFAFPASRRDRYQAFNAAVSYLLTRHVSIRFEAQSARNRSNADAYSFPRDVFSAKVRYEFK